MTETEKLREQAELQYAAERREELIEYLNTTTRAAGEALYWSNRADVLFIASGVNILVVVLAAAILNLSPVFTESVLAASQIVWLVAFVRQAFLFARALHKIGRLEGALNALKILGVINPEDSTQDMIRRQQPVENTFKRFKETFERIISQKKSYGVAH